MCKIVSWKAYIMRNKTGQKYHYRQGKLIVKKPKSKRQAKAERNEMLQSKFGREKERERYCDFRS